MTPLIEKELEAVAIAWEAELFKRFFVYEMGPNGTKDHVGAHLKLRDFISDLIAKERGAMRERVEKEACGTLYCCEDCKYGGGDSASPYYCGNSICSCHYFRNWVLLDALGGGEGK